MSHSQTSRIKSLMFQRGINIRLFLRHFLIGLTWTLLIGGMVLWIVLALMTNPRPALEAKKPATWSVEELQR